MYNILKIAKKTKQHILKGLIGITDNKFFSEQSFPERLKLGLLKKTASFWYPVSYYKVAKNILVFEHCFRSLPN